MNIVDLFMFFNEHIIAFVIIIAAFAAVVLMLDKIRHRKKKNNTITELKTAPPDKAHGIIFGKKGKNLVYSPTDAEGSVGLFSATGTGKTASVIIPGIRHFTGNCFAIDISGDICKNCPDVPNKLIFEPGNPESIPFNVFGPIDEMADKDDQNEALEQLAFLLMPDQPNINANAKYFLDNGRKILTAALIAYYHEGFDFIDICIKILSMGFRDLFIAIDGTSNEDAILYINSFEGVSDQNNAGCKQSCDDAIKLFATNAKVKRSIHRPEEGEIALESKMIENHSIFIVVPDDKLTLFAPMLNIITNQQLAYISTRKVNKDSKTILLALDEYASLKVSADLILEGLRKYRKRKCRIMLATQAIVDYDILYGHEVTRAILANMRFKVLLGGLGEAESQKYFSELIGLKETKKHSKSTSSTNTTYTESEDKEYTFSPADLDRQGKDKVILIHPEAEGYMILDKAYYFK